MAESPIGTRTPCVEFSTLYQHPLVEEPPAASAPLADRRQAMMLIHKAQTMCAECPLMQQCLYDAVVRFDVPGLAGGATTKQRLEIRAQLGLKVAAEDFDTMAGVTAPHRQVDHDEVVRLRAANPHASLETIAMRLGCSLSTVKRHMRKARAAAGTVTAPRKPALPTTAEVMAAYQKVMANQPRRNRVA